MESQSQNIKTISVIVIILLVLGVGYVLFGKYHVSNQEVLPLTSSGIDNKSDTVTVKNTPRVNGILPLPAGFPQDIPVESGGLIGSSITEYPAENAQQLSASYRSSKTISEKYSEYRNYMKRMGYQITENAVSSPTRAIFGTKKDTNLSVAISSSEGKTLVQLSYLLK